MTWRDLVEAAKGRAVVRLEDGTEGVLLYAPIPMPVAGRPARRRGNGDKALVVVGGRHVRVDPASIALASAQ